MYKGYSAIKEITACALSKRIAGADSALWVQAEGMLKPLLARIRPVHVNEAGQNAHFEERMGC